DIGRNNASQVINEHFNLSFFDFINKYRVEEAERLLESNQLMTITDIAFEAGFNNRVSFYKAFKKVHDITPTEYKDHFMAS
ncbi:MAG: AraC family transcriptional regulator, partial [Muricauda sp.]|nr:AraC family transcriptional regulator [Allomuricauda sp.]